MILLEEIKIFNIEGAIRGMRNPLNSWDKSDSVGDTIGSDDLRLATSLVRSGEEHSKFLRQIFITIDITAPIYFWKEMDQYKVGTVTDSTSTMHTLTKQPITEEMFSFDEDLDDLLLDNNSVHTHFSIWTDKLLYQLNLLRTIYLETKDIRYWRALIQLLPESFNQKRTWTANYAVLRNIYHQRKNHKLSEWRDFCKVIETLPYAEEFLIN